MGTVITLCCAYLHSVARKRAHNQRRLFTGEPDFADCREQRMRIGREMSKPETGSEACASSSSVQRSL